MDLNLASPLPFGFSIESGFSAGADSEEALADGSAGVDSGRASTGLSVGADPGGTSPEAGASTGSSIRAGLRRNLRRLRLSCIVRHCDCSVEGSFLKLKIQHVVGDASGSPISISVCASLLFVVGSLAAIRALALDPLDLAPITTSSPGAKFFRCTFSANSPRATESRSDHVGPAEQLAAASRRAQATSAPSSSMFRVSAARSPIVRRRRGPTMISSMRRNACCSTARLVLFRMRCSLTPSWRRAVAGIIRRALLFRGALFVSGGSGFPRGGPRSLFPRYDPIAVGLATDALADRADAHQARAVSFAAQFEELRFR